MSVRVGRALSLACIVVGCSSEPSNGENAAATSASVNASSAFVQVGKDGRNRARFFYKGQAFRFVGGNVSELPFLGLPGALSTAAVDAELDYAKAAGLTVVRVFGVDDTQDATAMAARLKTVLDHAQARGLWVTVALTHNYHQVDYQNQPHIHAVPGDQGPNGLTQDPNGFYSRACGPLMCLSDSWLDWGYGAYYKQYTTGLVSQLKTHPAVFSWDIANEVAGSSGAPGVVSLVRAFYVAMSAAIKQADPNHLVTTGMISSSWAGMSDADRDAVYGAANPNIDYLTVHEYDGADGNTFNQFAQDDEVWRANARYGKPVVVEELGVHRSTAAAAESAVRSYYANRFSPSDPNRQVSGILYWGISSTAVGGMADNVWSPQALGAYAWFNGFWQGWSSALVHEYDPPPCGVLKAGAALAVDQALTSCDGRFRLAMQGDGNLVLYMGSTPLWFTRTNGKAVSGAFMQTDGNFVLYATNGTPLFNTGTYGAVNAYLRLQNDGNLVVYDGNFAARWSSATCCH